MGKLEKTAKARRKKENIQNAVLSVIGVAGVLATVAIAPGVFRALPHIMGKQRYKLKFQTKTAVGRLLVKGYVRKNARGMLEITETGRRHLALGQARTTVPARAKRRWDHRYRLVMFDIPQRRKYTRDRLRGLMRDFGFLRLQDSVWISPYDCEDLVALAKAELRIGHDVLYAVVDQIGNDAFIKKHFGLC
ncbi:MAG: CRISPR-associated endonuclease Cas2 [Patescibacteria group bacterium]|nr:CRISPR-associated endonuclease Cas2 [bacterium]MDZ4227589.1 CRISPR-associated endonuclease Cas2 [Patescibacteria group bacterium]